MSARDLAALGLIGAFGWYAWRLLDGQTALPVAPPAGSGEGDYLAKLAAAENAKRDPLAKNTRSSASGLWQFVKKTWVNLGGSWGPDPTKPFGGLKPTVAEQNERLAMLTGQNATMLRAGGVAVSDATLYAAHFLGAPTAIRVWLASDLARLAPLIGGDAMAANKFPASMTVGQFRAWVRRRMGN